VRLEMTASVLRIAEGGTFEVHHNLLGRNHIVATMARNSDMLGLLLSLVVSLVSCSMGHGGRTGDRLEMVPAKAGNYTLVVVDEIDLRVARIECLCSVYFPYYHLMLPHCPLGVFVSQTAHPLEPYWLSSVEIRLSSSYVNITWW